MAAGSTYTPIATTTLTSATTSYTFSSIPSTYTDLVLIGSWRDLVSGSSLKMQFNSDTGTSYSNTWLYGTGSAAGSSKSSSVIRIYCGEDVSTASTWSPVLININNYSNTTTYKTAIVRNNPPGSNITATVGLWSSTSAINSIKLYVDNNFSIGTTFTLYGITAA